jgi:hypothetical protein
MLGDAPTITVFSCATQLLPRWKDLLELRSSSIHIISLYDVRYFGAEYILHPRAVISCEGSITDSFTASLQESSVVIRVPLISCRGLHPERDTCCDRLSECRIHHSIRGFFIGPPLCGYNPRLLQETYLAYVAGFHLSPFVYTGFLILLIVSSATTRRPQPFYDEIDRPASRRYSKS